MTVRLTTRQRDLLYHQLSDTAWLTPMMLGGSDGSHHSQTLAQLSAKFFRRTTNFSAAQMRIESQSAIIVGQSPDEQILIALSGKIFAHAVEQSPPKTQTLKFRRQI